MLFDLFLALLSIFTRGKNYFSFCCFSLLLSNKFSVSFPVAFDYAIGNITFTRFNSIANLFLCKNWFFFSPEDRQFLALLLFLWCISLLIFFVVVWKFAWAVLSRCFFLSTRFCCTRALSTPLDYILTGWARVERLVQHERECARALAASVFFLYTALETHTHASAISSNSSPHGKAEEAE